MNILKIVIIIEEYIHTVAMIWILLLRIKGNYYLCRSFCQR
jgi:hypothetical protein